MSEKGNENRMCWICHANEDEQPELEGLSSACLCTGSTGWVHHECLREYIRTKKRGNRRTTVRCPVCQQPYRKDLFTKRHQVAFQTVRMPSMLVDLLQETFGITDCLLTILDHMRELIHSAPVEQFLGIVVEPEPAEEPIQDPQAVRQILQSIVILMLLLVFFSIFVGNLTHYLN